MWLGTTSSITPMPCSVSAASKIVPAVFTAQLRIEFLMAANVVAVFAAGPGTPDGEV